MSDTQRNHLTFIRRFRNNVEYHLNSDSLKIEYNKIKKDNILEFISK
jgi:hypothetical protein